MSPTEGKKGYVDVDLRGGLTEGRNGLLVLRPSEDMTPTEGRSRCPTFGTYRGPTEGIGGLLFSGQTKT